MKRITLPLIMFGAWCLGMGIIFNDVAPWSIGFGCLLLAWLNEQIEIRKLLMEAGYFEKTTKNGDAYNFVPLRALFEESEKE